MSRESDFATRMTGDATLMAILTGGVFKHETAGIEGIVGSKGTGSSAFDANGYLKPCCLIKQRGRVPDGAIRDDITQKLSTKQTVELWFYEDKTYTSIDSAMDRCKALFVGYAFSDSFPVELANVIDRWRDDGALKGRSAARMDWDVRSIW